MIYYNKGAIRYNNFGDKYDPGWKQRWEQDKDTLKFNNMDELDKYFRPNELTTSDIWKLAGELAKENIIHDYCDQMIPDGRIKANEYQNKKTQIYLSYQYNLVAAIAKLEKEGLLNLEKPRRFY